MVNSTMVRGTYTIKVARDGSAEMYGVGTNTAADCVSQGGCMPFALTARGSKLVGLTDECADPADYSYKLSGSADQVQRVHDDCGAKLERAWLFDGITWRRQS